jgi:hypothetical protein
LITDQNKDKYSQIMSTTLFNNPEIYNDKVLEIMNKKYIIKLFLNNGTSSKYMLIRNELALRDNKGDRPYYSLQGEDIEYQYNYGTFHSGKELTSEQFHYYNSLFHCSGRVVFDDWITDWIIYQNEEDILNIEDVMEREVILKLHRDIQTYNWTPGDPFKSDK